MKKYLAIGHFKGSENMVSVAMEDASLKSFKENLQGNEFVAYAVVTEKKMDTLRNVLDDCFGLWDEVKKLTSNYRKWNDVYDYIGQCFDIMENKMANA